MRQLLVVVLMSALSVISLAQGQTTNPEVKSELNEGARQYKDGNFAEAQKHFERALELDPSNKNAAVFIARAIQQQYRPGVDTPENVSKAEEAIAAYKRVLAIDPNHDDAYNAVAYLYRNMRDEEKEREWLSARTDSPSASPEKRSDTYTILASKEWNCSFDITERKEHKKTVRKPDGVFIEYVKPKVQSDFDRARACALKGLELVEQAISLNPNNPNAWSYKTNLLREMAKMAQMEGNDFEKDDFYRGAEEAQTTQKRLTEEAAQKKEQDKKAPQEAKAKDDEQKSVTSPIGEVTLDAPVRVPDSNPNEATIRPSPPKPTPTPRKMVVSGGVLNGKVVSKPQPSYPEAAKAARVSGVVAVEVLVDEEGKVIEAKALSGNPLLRDPAVEAARKARFAPTRLRGEAVRVRGVITFNFALQ